MPTIGGLWTVSPYPPRTRRVPQKAAPGSRTWVQALACRGLCPALPAPCPCQGGLLWACVWPPPNGQVPRPLPVAGRRRV